MNTEHLVESQSTVWFPLSGILSGQVGIFFLKKVKKGKKQKSVGFYYKSTLIHNWLPRVLGY